MLQLQQEVCITLLMYRLLLTTDASRKRAFTLVSRAYSCIGANDFSAVTGLPVNEAIDGELNLP